MARSVWDEPQPESVQFGGWYLRWTGWVQSPTRVGWCGIWVAMKPDTARGYRSEIWTPDERRLPDRETDLQRIAWENLLEILQREAGVAFHV